MCIAIVKRATATVPIDHLKNGWIGNPDGGGFAYPDKGKLVTVKGLMTLKEFHAEYDKAIKKHADKPFLIHFRIRSMGDKSADNTHPHVYGDHALIHNGTIDGTTATYGNGPSDTVMFVNKFKDVLTLADVRKHKEAFNKALGYNKVCIMDKTGDFEIINESNGHWEQGVWYSNHTYKSYSRAGGTSNWGILTEDEEVLETQSLYDNSTFMR